MNQTPQALWAAAWRERPTPDHVHGTKNGYSNYGCRCTQCREANTTAVRAQRARKRGIA